MKPALILRIVSIAVSIGAVILDLSLYTARVNRVNRLLRSSTGAVRSLIWQGQDPNESGYNGITPLRHATYRNNAKVVKVLLEEGVDRRTPEAQDCLKIARRRGYREIERLLSR